MYSFRISGVHGTLSSQSIPLYYIIFRTGCQVRITLILFYYFVQHFITIFCATSHRYIFVCSASYIIGRNSPQKCNLDVQNLCPIRCFSVIFLAHFYTLNINLSNYIIPYILLLVKLRLRKLFLCISYKIPQQNILHIIFFHKHFCAFPSHYVYSKRLPTILPVRRACYMNTFV